MEENNDDKIMEFYNACTDLLNAKLILADAKIGKVLKTLSESPDLFAAVGECLVNFNFDTEFSKAQVKNATQNLYFKLPADKNKVVALVFNILSACDTHKLDLHSLIKDFFADDSGDMSYGFLNFVHKVVFPFRDALCEMVGCSQQEPEEDVPCCVCEQEPEEYQFEEGDVLGEFFSDAVTILHQIKEMVMSDIKVKQDRKDEIKITIDALIQTIDMGSLKIMNALLISLYYLLKPVKSVRFYKQELEDRCAKFYAELN